MKPSISTCIRPLRPLRAPIAAAALTCVALTSAWSREAEACGGTFCDQGPNSMPVDQSGENVIFVLDEGRVEAHIQIQYDPDTEAEAFAWVIPLQTLPEFSVGSDLFFDQTLAATVPVYGLTTSNSCSSAPTDSDSGGGFTGGFVSSDDSGAPPDDPGPEVVHRETVGAFDVVVLQGGTSQEVMTWLADNGYQQDPAAEPILEAYLSEGFLFAAIKLTHAPGEDAVHPIVLTMSTDEACIPLRLTQIAATQDMDVRAFFFGESRVVPTNYKHVEVNPLEIDWMNLAANYEDVITLAVDSEGAEGRAFVTEFAGDDVVMNPSQVYNGWYSEAFAGLGDSPVGIMDILAAQELYYCIEDFGSCITRHPLIEGLLMSYVPVPAGVDPFEFYSCVSCFEAQLDLDAWDAASFAADFESRIVAPGKRAATTISEQRYVTRLYTTISDHEMNEDPLFIQNPDLGEVSNIRNATRRLNCDGSAWMTLPDGTEVYMPSAGTWPDIYPDEMPWTMRVARGTPQGAMQAIVDNSDRIAELLARWNQQAANGEETGGAESSNGDADGGASADDPTGAKTSCACDSRGGELPVVALGFAFGLLGWRRRRPA